MGIVALDAVPLTHGLVGAEGLIGNYVRMARETDLVRGRCQHFPVCRGMRVMAARTFSCLYRRMYERLFELLPKFPMAGQANLPLCPRFQPELVLLRFRG